jgi:hypothetical protein
MVFFRSLFSRDIQPKKNGASALGALSAFADLPTMNWVVVKHCKVPKAKTGTPR